MSVEEAPVRVLEEGAVELTGPNRITAADFSGWVQERGLYFFGANDPRYTDLLASTDTWPNNPGEKRGMLTVATLGKGTWTYVGLGPLATAASRDAGRLPHHGELDRSEREEKSSVRPALLKRRARQ